MSTTTQLARAESEIREMYERLSTLDPDSRAHRDLLDEIARLVGWAARLRRQKKLVSA